MAEELKQLPNSGTQKDQRNFVFALVTAGWILSLVMLKLDWFTLEELKVFGVTFQNWWVVAGITGGLYVAGESQRKKADAMMNK